MALEQAQWRDILTVLHETFSIWSPGLPQMEYYAYIWRQMHHPWSRRNYRYLVLKKGSHVLASCKLYTIPMAARGRVFRFAGIGAVYTQQEHRGRGHGQRMLREIIEMSRKEGCAGLFLFSDIGPALYERLGFRTLGCDEFSLWLPDTADAETDERTAAQVASLLETETVAAPVQLEDIAWMARHHQRWLRRRPYGVARSTLYWRYKLGREIFLHEHSLWSWPRLELTTVCDSPEESGYAIFEYSARTLRALEVIGPESVRTRLWRGLLSVALRRGARRVRCWEGTKPEFLSKPALSPRDWGCPMMLPLSTAAEGWTAVSPCPILELDHL